MSDRDHHQKGKFSDRKPRHLHDDKEPSNAAEAAAVETARGSAEASGVHHRHLTNTGLGSSQDVMFAPHGTVASRLTSGEGVAYPGESVLGAVTPVTPAPVVTRPPVKKYVSNPGLPIEAGVRAGTHIIGELVVKKWTTAVAFVKSPHVLPYDVFVGGLENRGNALPGDIVVIQLKPQSEWKTSTREGIDSTHKPTLSHKAQGGDAATSQLEDGRTVMNVLKHDAGSRKAGDHAERLTRDLNGHTDFTSWPANLQPEGFVVMVLERRFDPTQCCRHFAGQPQPNQPAQGPPRIMNERFYRFKSYSDDFPIVAIYGRDIPSTFHDDITKYLFLVHINTEPAVQFADNRFPVGRVVMSLGQTGTVDAESAAISFTHKIKDAPFTEEVEECVMRDFVIPSASELKAMGRRDLREEEFVCTIDPATARDLDDALSICETPGGYRVGVHIADVSHFVPIHTPLDEEARERATSTYFIERVIPMLPRRLCEDYCSLNAGVDKFAFSGIWHFDRAGNVQSEWFGQSVIRNRCRMAYEDAQRIIDGDESGDSLNFVNENEPREVLVPKVVTGVKLLQELALKLRQRRFDRGALSLNKGKLKFIFEDFNSRLAPKGLTQERSRAANFLVEEFMLHANCRVGEKVVQYLPDCALLRKHDPPVKKKLKNFIDAAAKFGFKISSSGSKALRDSLDEYRDHPDSDCLRFMATICMSLAKYTSSEADKKTPVAHYALAAPIYTHFTSPIRRYADLVIHRQLLLALDIERELAKRGIKGDSASANAAVGSIDFNDLDHGDYYVHPSDVAHIAEQCNKKKEAAKKAGESSSSLFLCLFIRALEEKAKVEPRLPSKLVLRAVVVRIEEGNFTLYIPDIAMTYEIFHNTTFQRWQGENAVEEDKTAFVVTWGAHPNTNDVVTEKITLFSQVLVTLTAVVRGHMELQATIHPPWERDASRITPTSFEL
jgi:DIS3-like exonuclease 2